MLKSPPELLSPSGQNRRAARYKSALLDDIIPFWQKFGLDAECGGIITSLGRDGAVLDTDKSIWTQGRTCWMFATLYNHVEVRPQCLAAARSCLDFLRRFSEDESGKMWFSVTRDGLPLRMRRYVFSESFAAIANAAFWRATLDERAKIDAKQLFASYVRFSFETGAMAPKWEKTRPMKGLGAHMIAIVTAQELRWNLGD